MEEREIGADSEVVVGHLRIVANGFTISPTGEDPRKFSQIYQGSPQVPYDELKKLARGTRVEATVLGGHIIEIEPLSQNQDPDTQKPSLVKRLVTLLQRLR